MANAVASLHLNGMPLLCCPTVPEGARSSHILKPHVVVQAQMVEAGWFSIRTLCQCNVARGDRVIFLSTMNTPGNNASRKYQMLFLRHNDIHANPTSADDVNGVTAAGWDIVGFVHVPSPSVLASLASLLAARTTMAEVYVVESVAPSFQTSTSTVVAGGGAGDADVAWSQCVFNVGVSIVPSVSCRPCRPKDLWKDDKLLVYSHLRWDWENCYKCTAETGAVAAGGAGAGAGAYCVEKVETEHPPTDMVATSCCVIGCANHRITDEADKRARFRVPALCDSLVAIAIDENTFPVEASGVYANGNVTVAGAGAGGGGPVFDLQSLPTDALLLVLHSLGPHYMAHVAVLNKYLYKMSQLVTPGLSLTLFAHQRKAVAWMRRREAVGQSMQLAYIHRGRVRDGSAHVIVDCDPQAATVTIEPNDAAATDLCSISDIRGGLLCDEPGMGKTITILALILQTLRPKPLQNGTSKHLRTPILRLRKVKDGYTVSRRSVTTSATSFSPLSCELNSSALSSDGRSSSSLPSLPATPAPMVPTPSSASSPHLQTFGSHPVLGLGVDVANCSPVMGTDSASGSRSTSPRSPLCRTPSGPTALVSSSPRRSRRPVTDHVSRPNRATLVPSHSTLLVVPRTLVDHWKWQFNAYTAGNVLSMYSVEQASEMLSADMLAGYDVVITTFDLLSSEWSRLLLQQKASVRLNDSKAVPCPLLQVHWRRIVLDEGHTMGSLSSTNRQVILDQMSSSTRWICTGTPTPSKVSTELRHLHGLIRFLKVPLFSDMRLWQRIIADHFECCREEGWLRLRQLLSNIMIRATKKSIRDIGGFEITERLLEPNDEERRSYNKLVSTVNRNLKLGGNFNSSREAFLDSLLHRNNRKEAMLVLLNLRKACCITGQIDVDVHRHQVEELLVDLKEKHGCSALTVSRVDMLMARSPETGRMRAVTCEVKNCGTSEIMPIITTCGHFLCIGCYQPPVLICPVCHGPVDDDGLTKLQVPYEQEKWKENWLESGPMPTKVGFLLKRIEQILLQFHGIGDDGWPVAGFDCKRNTLPPKIIVFTNFTEFIDTICVTLSDRGIKFLRFHGHMLHAQRVGAVEDFRNDDTNTVLVMDSVGALGLDLSFVSWLFIMDPVWDSSLEDQIISRAHRIGASQIITVEKIIMKSTIEEQLARIHTGQGSNAVDSSGETAETPITPSTPSTPLTPNSGGVNSNSLSADAVREESAKMSSLFRSLRPLALLNDHSTPLRATTSTVSQLDQWSHSIGAGAGAGGAGGGAAGAAAMQQDVTLANNTLANQLLGTTTADLTPSSTLSSALTPPATGPPQSSSLPALSASSDVSMNQVVGDRSLMTTIETEEAARQGGGGGSATTMGPRSVRFADDD